MFNFLLPFLTKKEHLCVPDYSSSRGTSLQGVYALSTLLLHASQSWPLSRKQITPVLAIVNFFFAAARAHRRSIKLPSNLHRARFLGKSGSGTINKQGKENDSKRKRSFVGRSRSRNFLITLFCSFRIETCNTTNANDRNFILRTMRSMIQISC